MQEIDGTYGIYTIRYAAKQAGLTPALVRAWERRYKAICPERTPSNRRIYSKSDVARLQLLKKAVDEGHIISQVASLSSSVLFRLINGTTPPGKDTSVPSYRDDASSLYNAALESVIQLDATGLKNVLDLASVRLTKRRLINAVIVPLCKQMGSMWRRGNLKIIHEHLATPVIRSVMFNLLASLNVPREAPRIVVATPLDHRHELGALAIAIFARESGWRSSYFGSNLPADEIAAAAVRINARAVVLSITLSLNPLRLVKEIKRLRRHLSHDVFIFVGGHGAPSIIKQLKKDNVHLLIDLESLSVALDNLLRQGHEQQADP